MNIASLQYIFESSFILWEAEEKDTPFLLFRIGKHKIVNDLIITENSISRSASRASLNKDNGNVKKRRCCEHKSATKEVTLPHEFTVKGPHPTSVSRNVCCKCKLSESRLCPSRPTCRDFVKEKQRCILKYVQPERPESYRPVHLYKKPAAAVDGDTVYKLSYPGVDADTAADCRGEQKRQQDNLTSAGKFSKDTTHRHDYRGWPGANAANLILPEQRSLLGDGPMQSQTTHKHDYTPKPFTKTDVFRPDNNIRMSDKRMEDTSTMNASYQPIDKYDPVTSFKPQQFHKTPSIPFEDDTVHKMSYVPWPVPEKEDYPWAKKGKYNKPIMPMEGNTIYNNSYLPTNEDNRRDPIKHLDSGNILGAGNNFEDRTVYKESYLPVDEDCRTKPFHVSDNLTTGNAKFANQTTQRHDYKGWPGANPANLILPEQRSLLGDGPMQSQTTQKHDYTPKPFTKSDVFRPDNNIRISDKRMEDTSTMNASYQPIDKYDPVASFKPQQLYKSPAMPFEDDTVHKMSYVPWPVPEKEDYPWATKGKYNKPIMPMEGNTIYNNSYLPTCEDTRRDPIKHLDSGNILGAGNNFEDRTVYKESYLPVDEDCRTKPCHVSDNITTGNARFADQTTNRHDYKGWPGANPANLILPEQRSLLGDGPMQSQTTQKHDYTPKPFTKTDVFRPDNNIRMSDKRMEDTSTMNASYQPIDKYDPVASFKPQQFHKTPAMPFEDDTVHKMSYVPWPVPEKEDYPWAKKGKYNKPIMPFEGSTVYNNSYLTPGNFVCDEDQISVGGGDSGGGTCCRCCPAGYSR